MAQRFKTAINSVGRICTKCKEYKLRRGFYTNKAHSTGYFPHCKKCAMVYGYSTRRYKGNQEAKQLMKKKRGVGKVSGFIRPKE